MWRSLPVSCDEKDASFRVWFNVYEWVSGADLASTAPSELPLLTPELAQALLVYFDTIVPSDWSVVTDQRATRAHTDTVPVEQRALRNAKSRIDVCTETIKRALQCIDPDIDYLDWCKVGMALHHQYSGDADGFKLWDWWSSLGTKYRPEEMRKKWHTFEADLLGSEPVTAATILKMGGGAKAKQSQLAKFLETYVFVEEDNLVCDLTRPRYCSVSRLKEFENATANLRHPVPAPTKAEPERVTMKPVHQLWLIDENRKTARGVKYEPGRDQYFKDDFGLFWINTFCFPEAKPEPYSSTDVFYEHMDYLFPVPQEREWFVDWIAFNLTRPNLRSKVTPLHVATAHGTGRGWVVQLMGRLLGEWNCARTSMAALTGEGRGGQYQEYLNRTLFCAIEEVRDGKRYSVSDKIRDILEAPHLEVNVKWGTKQTQPVYTNFFFMSNHPDALVIGREDRRINVFEGPQQARSNAYYVKLYNWLESDAVDALRQELLNRNLSGFNWQRSFETAARMRMIEDNRTETETLFHELLENPPFPAMVFDQIVRTLTQLSERDAFEANIDEGQLVKLLQHHAHRTPRMAFGGREGKRGRAWVFDNKIKNDAEAIRSSVVKCRL